MSLDKKTIKQLEKEGYSIFANKWEKPPVRKASDYINNYRDWVYSATKKNAQAFSDLELKLYEGNNRDFKEIPEHPALDLLNKVNDFMDYTIFLRLIQTYFELVGENFCYTVPDLNGVPTELIPLRPDRITIEPDKSEKALIKRYRYRNGNGEDIYFEPEEILKLTYPNPNNPFRGVGTVQAAALEIDTERFSAEYNRDFFYNSATPQGAWITEQKLNSKTTRKRLEEKIKNKHGGRKNAHKPLLLEGGLKWESMGIPQKDMEFLNQRKFSRDAIFSMFDIPKDLINTEDSNRASVKEAIKIYMKFGIKPRMKIFVSMLNEFYLPLFGENLFFDFIDPSPSDIEDNVKIAQTVPLTDNEIRELFGWEPIDGGDQIRDSRIPQEILQNPNSDNQDANKSSILYKLKDSPGKKQKFNVHVKSKTFKEKKTEEKIKAIVKEQKDRIKSIEEHKELLRRKQIIFNLRKEGLKKSDPTPHTFTKEQKDVMWKLFDDQLTIWEKRYNSKLTKYFKFQKDRLLKQLRSRKSEVKGISDINFNLPREKVVFVSFFRDLVERLIKTSGFSTFNFLGIGNRGFDMSDPRVVKFINELGFEFVNDINETTKAELQKTLNEGIKNGEGIQQLGVRIESVFKGISTRRKRTIARTETLRAFNFATLEGYRQSGVVKGKEWLSTRDNRVRETHQPGVGVDGEIRPLGAKFSNDVMTPGFDGPAEEVINCRCTTIPVLIDTFKGHLPSISEIEKRESVKRKEEFNTEMLKVLKEIKQDLTKKDKKDADT